MLHRNGITYTAPRILDRPDTAYMVAVRRVLVFMAQVVNREKIG